MPNLTSPTIGNDPHRVDRKEGDWAEIMRELNRAGLSHKGIARFVGRHSHWVKDYTIEHFGENGCSKTSRTPKPEQHRKSNA